MLNIHTQSLIGSHPTVKAPPVTAKTKPKLGIPAYPSCRFRLRFSIKYIAKSAIKSIINKIKPSV